MANPDFHYFARNGLGQAAVADAAVAFVISGSGDTTAEVLTNISGVMSGNAAKLNDVIHALEDAGILLVS